MLLGSVLCVSLVLSVHSYNDYLTHTALDQVPATLGDDLQIRCTKIVESYRARCDPQDKDLCYHVMWTKNGKELSKGDKYSFKSSITFDYCENFELSTDIVKKLKLDLVQMDNSSTRYNSNNIMKCYASALTINKVQEKDLGDYECHFRKNNDSNHVDVQSINIYNRKTSVQLPLKVEYFENFYTKGIRSKLLMQCVVTGAPVVHWFIRSESEVCPRWSDEEWNKCINNTMQPLEDIVNTLDMWYCYNFTTESHNPYHNQNITESFIYFENICAMDWGSIYCSADTKGGVRSKGGYIVVKDQWQVYWYYYHIEDQFRVLCIFLIPTVIVLFFTIGGILACVRGRGCSCGNPGTRAHPHYQQPVFRYHALAGTMSTNVFPQQGYAPPHAGQGSMGQFG